MRRVQGVINGVQNISHLLRFARHAHILNWMPLPANLQIDRASFLFQDLRIWRKFPLFRQIDEMIRAGVKQILQLRCRFGGALTPRILPCCERDGFTQ